MKGIDFLEKINDIDDDLLSLEPIKAKSTPLINERKKHYIGYIVAAAAVLIIGGLVAFPFLRSGDQGKLLTRTKSEDSMSISKGENAAIDDEDMNDSIEVAAEETEAGDRNYSTSKGPKSQDTTTTVSDYSYTLGGDGSIAYDYILENKEDILYDLNGYNSKEIEDLEVSLASFTWPSINDVKSEKDNVTRYFPVFDGSEVVAFIEISDTDYDDCYLLDDSDIIETFNSVLKEHSGETVVFVKCGNSFAVVFEDDSYVALDGKKIGSYFDNNVTFESLKTQYNTYTIR